MVAHRRLVRANAIFPRRFRSVKQRGRSAALAKSRHLKVCAVFRGELMPYFDSAHSGRNTFEKVGLRKGMNARITLLSRGEVTESVASVVHGSFR